MYLDEIREKHRGERSLEVVAVATDTTGKEYVQKRKDSLAVRPSS